MRLRHQFFRVADLDRREQPQPNESKPANPAPDRAAAHVSREVKNARLLVESLPRNMARPV